MITPPVPDILTQVIQLVILENVLGGYVTCYQRIHPDHKKYDKSSCLSGTNDTSDSDITSGVLDNLGDPSSSDVSISQNSGVLDNWGKPCPDDALRSQTSGTCKL